MMLIWNDEVTKAIQRMIDYAHAHQLTYAELQDTVQGKRAAIGDANLNHVLMIPIGFKVVYSEENQKQGLYKHLSISYEGKQPPFPAVRMLLEAFKFRNKIDLAIDLEKNIKPSEFMFWWDDKFDAINFLERY